MKIWSRNKIMYKGIILDVTPEFIQDAIAGSVTIDEVTDHLESLYNKHKSVIRGYKLNQILGE